MSEYEALREDIGHVAASLASYSETAVSHLLEQSRQIDKLWADNAALRDDLHALANRVETLTRARLTEPAEVAERMIFTCPVNAGCNLSRPHVHHDDGAVIYVTAAEDARRYYEQRDERDAIVDAANVRRMAKEYE
jgi:hypothetical protein